MFHYAVATNYSRSGLLHILYICYIPVFYKYYISIFIHGTGKNQQSIYTKEKS